MTSNLEIGSHTASVYDEDDDLVEVSPTSTLQRGHTTSPASPVQQSGILARFRYSFSNQKVKDLKRQISVQEDEIGKLNALLQTANQVSTDVHVCLNDQWWRVSIFHTYLSYCGFICSNNSHPNEIKVCI